MNEVMAIIRPDRWRATQSRIEALGLPECIQHRVLGRGRERGLRYLSRQGAAAGTGVQFFPKRMLWWIVEESQVESLIEAIIDAEPHRRIRRRQDLCIGGRGIDSHLPGGS